jgi:hypothetical protein
MAWSESVRACGTLRGDGQTHDQSRADWPLRVGLSADACVCVCVGGACFLLRKRCTRQLVGGSIRSVLSIDIVGAILCLFETPILLLRPDALPFVALTKVIIPGVSWECGRELVHYLYHDELSRTLNPASSMPGELLQVPFSELSLLQRLNASRDDTSPCDCLTPPCKSALDLPVLLCFLSGYPACPCRPGLRWLANGGVSVAGAFARVSVRRRDRPCVRTSPIARGLEKWRA